MGIAIAASLGAAPAAAIQAWKEGREEGSQTRVQVEPNGVAQVGFQIRYRVVHGPLHALEVFGIAGAADVDPRVVVSADDGRELTAHADRTSHDGVRLVLDDSRGLPRGVFTFDLRWQCDLLRSGALSRRDSGWTFTWSSPRSLDGFDSARTVFEFPAAPDAPQTISAATGASDEVPGAVLRRSGPYDEMEIVTPHVSPGQALVSTMRLDERALALPAPPPPLASPHGPSEDSDPVRGAVFGAGLALLALSLSLALARANRTLAEACAARGVAHPGGLLPVPHAVRIVLSGLSLAAGVGLQAREEFTAGGACVALATVFAAIRRPIASPTARGPGRWLPLGPERASLPEERVIASWPNLRTRAGRTVAGIFGVLVVAGVFAARWLEAPDPWLVALDAAPFVPLLVLGRGVYARPAEDPCAVPWIMKAWGRLRRAGELHSVLWGRVAGARGAVDELRVLAIPRAPLAGLVGIEIGLAWSATPGGWSSSPEVLVRVRSESPASEALSRAFPRLRTLPGRRNDERVARLVPRLPSRSCAVALVAAVGARMTDRRVAPNARTWTAPERRREPGLQPTHSAAVRASSPGTGVAA
jgi:hypothetical protein